jgi:hypothetical protein
MLRRGPGGVRRAHEWGRVTNRYRLGGSEGVLVLATAIARIIARMTWWLALIEPGNDMCEPLAPLDLTGNVH